ncbi:MAG: hypothetical protein AAGB04_00130 [Pseudomonadota bacterium]
MVDFETMMGQSSAGFITVVIDGQSVEARRAPEKPTVKKDIREDRPDGFSVVSDALGFTEDQFTQFEADRVRHGFTSVSFQRDRDVPEFFQVKFESKRDWERYIKHRGMADRNSGLSPNTVTPRELLRAEKWAQEKYPVKKKVDAN